MWNVVYTVGRIAVAAIFIWSGAMKLMAPAALTAMLSAKSFPMPMLWTYAAGVAELTLGALVAIGWQTRLASFGLVAFTVVATLIAHDFWNMSGAARSANQIHTMKNLSIIGALLMLMAAGAGRFSVDRR